VDAVAMIVFDSFYVIIFNQNILFSTVMAEPIHEVPHQATLVAKSAQQEWQDILQLLQEQGVFKFLHTALEALPDITALLVSSVDNPFGKNTLANLMLLFTMLGKIDPQEMASFVDAGSRAMQTLKNPHPAAAESPFKVMYHLLRDKQLWHTLDRFSEAFKTFATNLEQSQSKI
jgi:uncharacterized protein YjgD (DUF1641 family)